MQNNNNNYLMVYLIEKKKPISLAQIPINKYVTSSTIEALAESTDASSSDLSYLIIKDESYKEALEKNDVSIVKEVFESYKIPEVKDRILIYGKDLNLDNLNFNKNKNKNIDFSYSIISNLLKREEKAMIFSYNVCDFMKDRISIKNVIEAITNKNLEDNAYSQQNTSF